MTIVFNLQRISNERKYTKKQMKNKFLVHQVQNNKNKKKNINLDLVHKQKCKLKQILNFAGALGNKNTYRDNW